MSDAHVFLQAEGLAVTFVLLLIAFAAAAIIAFVLVAVWLYNDTKQRGENTGLWLTLFLAVGLLTTFLGAVVVLVIYLATRSAEIKYDRQGNLLVPSAPPQPGGYGSMQPTWTPAPTTQPAVYVPPSPPLPASVATTPMQQPYLAPKLSKVRCPRCRTVFEYQKQPVGATHVKCSACGEEGNI